MSIGTNYEQGQVLRIERPISALLNPYIGTILPEDTNYDVGRVGKFRITK